MLIHARTAVLAGLCAFALAAFAQTQPAANAQAPTAASAALSDGEVRKVDKEGRKLTIKHGPLANLDMPAMTMVFQVKEDVMLDRVQAGDKVRFQAEKIDGKFTVTRLEAAR